MTNGVDLGRRFSSTIMRFLNESVTGYNKIYIIEDHVDTAVQ